MSTTARESHVFQVELALMGLQASLAHALLDFPARFARLMTTNAYHHPAGNMGPASMRLEDFCVNVLRAITAFAASTRLMSASPRLVSTVAGAQTSPTHTVAHAQLGLVGTIVR